MHLEPNLWGVGSAGQTTSDQRAAKKSLLKNTERKGLKPSVMLGGHCSLYGNMKICYALSKLTQRNSVFIYLHSCLLYKCVSSPGQA